MIEREMEDLLWENPEKLLNEPLKQFRRQPSDKVGRADLVFEDKYGNLLVIELKLGKMGRDAIGQLHDYFGMLKKEFPDRPVEMMVVANAIHQEGRLSCENNNIYAREIPEKKFRDVAEEVGYIFESEQPPDITDPKRTNPSVRTNAPRSARMFRGFHSHQKSSDGAEEDFLERCNDAGKEFFLRFFEGLKPLSGKVRITWDHESGFSLQFQFRRLGYVAMLWGFPALNKKGQPSKYSQMLVLPFDNAFKHGVSEEFINDFGEAISACGPSSGGQKRPSFSVLDLGVEGADHVIGAIAKHSDAAAKEE